MLEEMKERNYSAQDSPPAPAPGKTSAPEVGTQNTSEDPQSGQRALYIQTRPVTYSNALTRSLFKSKATPMVTHPTPRDFKVSISPSIKYYFHLEYLPVNIIRVTTCTVRITSTIFTPRPCICSRVSWSHRREQGEGESFPGSFSLGSLVHEYGSWHTAGSQQSSLLWMNE